jgi:putative redox protein
MKIEIERVAAPYHFRATTEKGQVVEIDSAPEGIPAGASPMQLVAMAVGGCSGIDLIHILAKGRHEVQDLAISIEAERAPSPPRVFTQMTVHYELTGDLQEDVVRRAVRLSLDKYCSVSKMVESTATITATFGINGERYDA